MELNYIIKSFERRTAYVVLLFYFYTMQASDVFGTVGVTMLLAAYFFHLRNIISKEGYFYIGLNFFGAVISCIASVLLHFYPFVILETVWALVSLLPLVKWNNGS